MTDIEGFLTIYGHSDNLLNNKSKYSAKANEGTRKHSICLSDWLLFAIRHTEQWDEQPRETGKDICKSQEAL